MTVVAVHEAVHHVRANNKAGYDVLKKFARRYLELEGENVHALLKEIKENRKAQGENLTPEEIMEELVANTISSIASNEKAMLAFLKMDAKERVTLRRVLQSIAERVKSIASKLTGAESRVLLKDSDNLLTLAKELNKALKDAGESAGTQKNTAQSGVRYHAKQSDKNPSYLDATTVTEKDVMSLIIDAANGVYNNKAYIPVRVSTPGIIQERLFVENLPMVMPVKKIKQALKADDGVQKGNIRRGHGFTESDIIEIIKRIDEPDYLFSQPANDRGIAVINYSFDSDSTIIIVEFGCNINPAYLSGFEGGTYNLAISMFDIDGGVIGLFEYAKSNNWVEVFNKEKEGNPAKKFPTIKPFAVEQDTLTNNISNLNEDVKKNSFSDAEEKAKLKNVFGFDIEKGITVNEDLLE